MAKTYQISNNIIFCVNEDGPLSEITTFLKSEKQKLADAKQSVEVALSNLRGKIGMTYPLIISDIEIANVTYDGTSKPFMGIQSIVAIPCI